MGSRTVHPATGAARMDLAAKTRPSGFSTSSRRRLNAEIAEFLVVPTPDDPPPKPLSGGRRTRYVGRTAVALALTGFFTIPLHRCWRPRRVVVSVRGEGETAMKHLYRSGIIVNGRGREWIGLPSREPELLRLRLAATRPADEIGRDLPLEPERVRPGRFSDPDPVGGDMNGIITLFDAARPRPSFRGAALPLGEARHHQGRHLRLNYLNRSA